MCVRRLGVAGEGCSRKELVWARVVEKGLCRGGSAVNTMNDKNPLSSVMFVVSSHA